MKSKPTIAWTTHVNKDGGYRHLIISVFNVYQDKTDTIGFADSYHSEYNRHAIDIKWQSHPGSEWYGGKFETSARNADQIKTASKTICALAGDDYEPSPKAVIERLTSMKNAIRVFYSSPIGRYCKVEDYDKVKDLVCWYDTGIKNEGCTVNAFTTSTDYEDGQKAVAEALKSSNYCSPDEFAKWVNDGKQVRQAGWCKPQSPRTLCSVEELINANNETTNT